MIGTEDCLGKMITW